MTASSLVIGIDGMCWPGFVAARRQGLVPNLARLADGGSAGLLRGVPMLGRLGASASLASGHWPESGGPWHRHEIWAGGVRPATRASWQQPPFWERLANAGVSTATLGWPASAPGAASSGAVVDDRFMAVDGQSEAGWALPPSCCPPDWRDDVADRRVHPAAISARHLRPIVDVAAVDQHASEGLGQLATAMAAAASVQGVAAWLLTGPRPAMLALWWRWLADVRASVAGAAAPWDAMEPGGWRFLDQLVGSLAALAPDRRIIVVGSGWQAAPGLILAAGGGMAARVALPPAQLIDVAPTILALHGWQDGSLPGRALRWPGRDADGPLRSCPGEAAGAIVPANPVASAALLAPLLEEGHRPPPMLPPDWLARRHAAFGRMLLPRDPAAAMAQADAALALAPDQIDALLLKAWCCFAARDATGLDAIGRGLAVLAPAQPWAAVARGAAAALAGDAVAARPWLAQAADSDDDNRFLAAQAWLMLGQWATARQLLIRLAVALPGRADVLLALAVAHAAVGDAAAAGQAVRAAIDVDPFAPASWAALRRLLAGQGRADDVAAIDAVLDQLQPG